MSEKNPVLGVPL